MKKYEEIYCLQRKIEKKRLYYQDVYSDYSIESDTLKSQPRTSNAFSGICCLCKHRKTQNALSSRLTQTRVDGNHK